MVNLLFFLTNGVNIPIPLLFAKNKSKFEPLNLFVISKYKSQEKKSPVIPKTLITTFLLFSLDFTRSPCRFRPSLALNLNSSPFIGSVALINIIFIICFLT